MEALQQFDASIFTTLNSWHALYLDNFMALVTVVATWLPIILMLLFMLYKKKGWRKTLVVILAVAVVILIADQVSASIIKPLVGRLRPSRNNNSPCKRLQRREIWLRLKPCSQLLWRCNATGFSVQESCFHMVYDSMGITYVLQPHISGCALSWRHRVRSHPRSCYSSNSIFHHKRIEKEISSLVRHLIHSRGEKANDIRTIGQRCSFSLVGSYYDIFYREQYEHL